MLEIILYVGVNLDSFFPLYPINYLICQFIANICWIILLLSITTATIVCTIISHLDSFQQVSLNPVLAC